jgi:hypothetical protein
MPRDICFGKNNGETAFQTVAPRFIFDMLRHLLLKAKYATASSL